jgi:hypothetical protein
MEVWIAGQIDWLFLAQFHPSLTEVCHVAWCGAHLEMMGRTKGPYLKGLGETGRQPHNRDANLPSTI